MLDDWKLLSHSRETLDHLMSFPAQARANQSCLIRTPAGISRQKEELDGRQTGLTSRALLPS